MPEYPTCFAGMKKTCEGTDEKQNTVDEKTCKKLCHENTQCNFIFFVNSICIMYQSCEVTREPAYDNGITYAKDACPAGRMFPIYTFSILLFVFNFIDLV